MISVARTTKPEYAANLLVRAFRQVLVQAHYDNLDAMRIRFRADLVEDERVFFAKVPSQIRKWRERGGLLISWRRVDEREGPHDAILFAECPKSIEGVYRGTSLTRHLAVIYEPPTWRAHEETIAARKKHSAFGAWHRHTQRLTIMRDYMKSLPEFRPAYLVRRQRAPAAASQPSCAPESPAAAAPPSGTPR